ncbi:MAG: hypothetical protein TR69_WS6001001407 [candidate division WS6 bacterium OLB20]|uniref:Phosphotransferase enzyme family protein n=1 Tax=candidate division WS6 bacterium OLB20 TaxID=1617426 RepID=A0A136LVW8_9BACT|nr:MAG: hypothetical protein TR69_WS6001001407 [candidate division WS6 bacterium OLB20]
MERILTPDMGLQWVHDSVSVKDFEVFLRKLFAYLTGRPQKKASAQEFADRRQSLYLGKVLKRTQELKQLPAYPEVAAAVALSGYPDIDAVIARYERMLTRALKRSDQEQVSVIGHGDLFFANILYYKETGLMKFIDVKGALTEEDMWTDPYYDLAKMSHSVNGNYDFITSDLFDLMMTEDCRLTLRILKKDTADYSAMFRQRLEQAGYDYMLVRLFEASLFLSMLPLHIDHPRRVIAFIYNAISILDDLEQ